MFAPGPSFALPTVLDALGYSPVAWERPGTSPPQRPAWLGATATTEKGLAELASAIGPLLASIALAGYEVDLIAAAPLTAGASVDGHVVLETAGMAYTYSETALDVAVGHSLPPGATLSLGCHVTPRRRFRSYASTMTVGQSLAMALPGLHAPSDPGPPIGGGPAVWLGTGATGATWELLHDPDCVRPDGGGWWLIGLSASAATMSLSVIAAAAVDAVAQLGPLVGDDLHATWTATPIGTTLPGLLRVYDADSWQFPDGETLFAERLRAHCHLVQGWLGRRSPHAAGPVAFPAGVAQVANFFLEETGQHTGRLEVWLNLATGASGGSVMVDSLAEHATETLDAAGIVFGPSEHRIRAALRLTWAEAVMALHELGLVDVLGREQIGAVSAPEWVAVDGTGFFEQRDGDDPTSPLVVNDGSGDDDTGIVADTAQIKIAGDRLVGYWQEHERRKESPRHAILSILEGHRDPNQPATFICTRTPVAGGPAQGCTVALSNLDEMTLLDVAFDGDPGASVTLVRQTIHPFLSDDELALVDPTVAATVTELQRHPLHSSEISEVFDVADQLVRDVDAHFEDSDAMTATQVDAHFADAIAPHVTYNANGSTRDSSAQLLQVRLLLRAEMKERTTITGPWWWPDDVPVDYVRRIQDMKVGQDDPLPALTAFFDLGTNFFWYDWTLEANPGGGGGFNFGIGGTAYWSATMTIRKWRYRLGQPDHLDWEASYWAAFVGGGVGVVVELTSGFRSTGKSAWVRMDLSQEWFEGAFATYGAQGGLSKGPIPSLPLIPDIAPYTRDKSRSGSSLSFGPHPGDAQGNNMLWTDASGVSDLKGIYVGSELAATRGELHLWNPGDEIPVLEESGDLGPRAEIATITYEGPTDGERFFDSDVSTVDPVMWIWLRDFCLEHLHLFRNRQAALAIVGHADPEGSDEYNLALSVARASSVYQAFSDVLGPHLFLPEEHTFVGGRGEWESAGETHPELFQGDRRVDLYLNGDRVISVQAADGP